MASFQVDDDNDFLINNCMDFDCKQQHNHDYDEQAVDSDDDPILSMIRDPNFLSRSTPHLLATRPDLARKWRLDDRYLMDREEERERERPKQRIRFKLRYLNGSPCCIECGENQKNGYFNDNFAKNEEDLFWCTDCIKISRYREYMDAIPMRSYCSSMNECPLHIEERVINIDDTDNVKVVRKHILLFDSIEGIRYVKGRKIDSNDGKNIFYCNECWKRYRDCNDLIFYDYKQSPYSSQN